MTTVCDTSPLEEVRPHVETNGGEATVCDTSPLEEVRPHVESNGKEATPGVDSEKKRPEASAVVAKPDTALSHCKNDSGSYEGAGDVLSGKTTTCGSHGSSSHGSSSSGCGSSGIGSPSQKYHHPVTITISNGKGNEGAEGLAHSAPPPRTTSAASMHSSIGPDHSSSSSSLSRDLSAINSSFNSQEMLEQMLSEMSPDSEDQEVVKQLLEHIVSLKLEMENLRLENEKLKEMRTTMDDEMHTLTENLFEEAYKMVDTVKEEKGVVSKRLADAAGKMDAMETEMSALKNLLQPAKADKKLTSGSASLDTGRDSGKKSPSQHHKHHRPNVKKAIRKLSRKVKSSTLSRSSSSSASSSQPVTLVEHKNEIHGTALREGKVTSGELGEFREWLRESVRGDHPYLQRLEATDVQPCLNFHNKELSARLIPAARTNDLVMECLPPCAEGESRMCALSQCRDMCCTHRIQLGFSDQWYFISEHCRNRIAAACDFYTYIGHIAKGFIKLEAEQLFWQVSRLRAMMNLARLNLDLPD